MQVIANTCHSGTFRAGFDRVAAHSERVFERVGENHLDEGSLASTAIAGKAFYLRTRTDLYRIQEK